MNQEQFASLVLGQVSSHKPQFPQVAYDPDGDCIEFLACDEDFYARRVDEMITVYVSRDSGKIIGSLIKGINNTISKLLKKYPGFGIEIRSRRLRLDHLFTAVLWEKKEDDGVMEAYLRLREVADETKAQAKLEPAEA